MILVLEVGLFRTVSRRGAARAFWLGFQVAGWAYVITAEVFSWTAWRLARSLFEGWVLKRPIGLPFEMQRFILFAGGLQLLVSLVVALVTGLLTRLAWSRWSAVRVSCADDGTVPVRHSQRQNLAECARLPGPADPIGGVG